MFPEKCSTKKSKCSVLLIKLTSLNFINISGNSFRSTCKDLKLVKLQFMIS